MGKVFCFWELKDHGVLTLNICFIFEWVKQTVYKADKAVYKYPLYRNIYWFFGNKSFQGKLAAITCRQKILILLKVINFETVQIF